MSAWTDYVFALRIKHFVKEHPHASEDAIQVMANEFSRQRALRKPRAYENIRRERPMNCDTRNK